MAKTSLDPNFLKNMQKIRKKSLSKVADAILISTKLVETSAKLRVQGGAKTGAVYQKYRPRREHQASAPGEAPATDQGGLVQSINGYVNADKLSGGVEATAKYAEDLELGTRKMDARPFLTPSLKENKRQIVKIIKKALKF